MHGNFLRRTCTVECVSALGGTDACLLHALPAKPHCYILKELSDRHQVISITHTPQIAARADKHYFVYKKIVDNRTLTNIRLLNTDERIRSIAVMLSGNPPSDAAITTANELVNI